MTLIGERQEGMPRRVVLLGSTGFLGRRLVQQLHNAGLVVLGLGSADVDLTSAEAARKLDLLGHDRDVLIFLSAITRDRGRDATAFMRNVAMGAHVAAAITSRLGHVVYVSSDAVYGNTPALPITENTPLDPACLYGTAHVAREIMLREACGAAGVPLAIVRPTILYGAGDTHGNYGPNRFFRTAAQGVINLFGGGEERRDLLLVDDAAALVERIISERAAGIFNAATGTSHTFEKMARLVAAAVPGPVHITSVPRATGGIVHRDFDVSALAGAFPGFSCTPIEEGIAMTASVLFPGVRVSAQ